MLINGLTRFHFADPTAIERFKNAIDHKHGDKIESIILTIHSARREVRYRWENALADDKVFNPAKHFPNLRTVIIKLREQYELLDEVRLSEIFTQMALQFLPCSDLEWIHVNGVINENPVKSLRLAVAKPQSSGSDEREHQLDVTKCW